MLKMIDILRDDSNPQVKKVVALFDRAYQLEFQLSRLVKEDASENSRSLIRIIQAGQDRLKMTALAETLKAERVIVQIINVVALEVATELKSVMGELRMAVDELLTASRGKAVHLDFSLRRNNSGQPPEVAQFLGASIILAGWQLKVDKALTLHREHCTDNGREAIFDACCSLQEKVRAGLKEGCTVVSRFFDSIDEAPVWALWQSALFLNDDACLNTGLTGSGAIDSNPRCVKPQHIQAASKVKYAQSVHSSLYCGSRLNIKNLIKTAGRKIPELVLANEFDAVDEQRLSLEEYLIADYHCLRKLDSGRRDLEKAITEITADLQNVLLKPLQKHDLAAGVNLLIDYGYLVHFHKLLAHLEEPFELRGEWQVVSEALQATAVAALQEGSIRRYQLAWQYREDKHEVRRSQHLSQNRQ